MKKTKLATGGYIWMEQLGLGHKWCVTVAPTYGPMELVFRSHARDEAQADMDRRIADARRIDGRGRKHINAYARQFSAESRLD